MTDEPDKGAPEVREVEGEVMTDEANDKAGKPERKPQPRRPGGQDNH
jgi:hypothetical protein